MTEGMMALRSLAGKSVDADSRRAMIRFAAEKLMARDRSARKRCKETRWTMPPARAIGFSLLSLLSLLSLELPIWRAAPIDVRPG